ncbi:MAG: EF-hand domain-containing protein [Terracidiphilus sp.]|jgi:hypothetical protein
MISTAKRILAVVIFVGLFATAVSVKTGLAARQSTPSGQSASPVPAPTPVITPTAPEVVAASPEAVKLLKLMDTDRNGKISRAEYMAFMSAEFDRLDVNHDGELDVKELEKSQLAVAHHGGTRR